MPTRAVRPQRRPDLASRIRIVRRLQTLAARMDRVKAHEAVAGLASWLSLNKREAGEAYRLLQAQHLSAPAGKPPLTLVPADRRCARANCARRARRGRLCGIHAMATGKRA